MKLTEHWDSKTNTNICWGREIEREKKNIRDVELNINQSRRKIINFLFSILCVCLTYNRLHLRFLYLHHFTIIINDFNKSSKSFWHHMANSSWCLTCRYGWQRKSIMWVISHKIIRASFYIWLKHKHRNDVLCILFE